MCRAGICGVYPAYAGCASPFGVAAVRRAQDGLGYSLLVMVSLSNHARLDSEAFYKAVDVEKK